MDHKENLPLPAEGEALESYLANISPELHEAAIEKYQYSTFVQQKTSFSRSQIGHRIVPLNGLELPNNSVLHLIDKLLVPESETRSRDFKISPDVTNPLIVDERYVKYLHHWTILADAITPLFPVSTNEHPNYRPLHFASESRNFFLIHKDIKRMPTQIEQVLTRENVLSIFNYNALLSLTLPGRFTAYRKFDIIFRTILSSINEISGKHQYLEIPLSNRVYAKQRFTPAFEKLDPSTIKIFDDYSYFVTIHLLGLFHEGSSTSLFKLFPQEKLDEINLIFTAHGQAIIYNLGTVLRLSSGDAFFTSILRHLTMLKLLDNYTPEHLAKMDDKSFDNVTEDHEAQTESQMVTHPKQEPPHLTSSSPTTTKEPSKEEPKHIVETPLPKKQPILTPTESIDAASIKHIDEHELVRTPEQRSRAVAASERYKDVMIGGRRVGDLLADTTPIHVPTARLEFLAQDLPDASMAESSISHFDNTYLEKMHARDLAGVLSSFNRNGMFLIDCEEEITHTQLNRVASYKVTFEDATGKRHRIAFKFPIVDDQGVMLVNKIESRMAKQQVNLPICKLSPMRVSLASNYNKTLVERTMTKAHRFDIYLTRCIQMIQQAKLGLQIAYGHTKTRDRLPYDYSCIANKYRELKFGGYNLTFDYAHRLGTLEGAKEAYRELHGTFTHDGVLYDLSELFKYTEKLPTQEFKVSDLKWVLKADKPDPKRVAAADLNAPILVAYDKRGKLTVIDGLHRLAKAVAEGRTKIIGHMVSQELLESVRIQDSALEALNSDLVDLEKTYGIYCGTLSGVDTQGLLVEGKGYSYKLFYGYDNLIHFIGPNRGNSPEAFSRSITEILMDNFGDKVELPKRVPSEWTELKIKDKSFPLVFVLGFQYGLKYVLNRIGLKYTFVPRGTRYQSKPTEISVIFRDGTIWFDRYPLETSLIAAGLLKFKLSGHLFEEFDSQDVYYTVLQEASMSMNYLKGIAGYFSFFVDPITKSVLEHMKEPTDPGLLLLRANQMLSTQEALPASSFANLRLRGYERMNATLYNILSRSLEAYQNQKGTKKPFSINPNDVFQKIMQDPTVGIVETINPMHDLKGKMATTYSGQGGRTAQSFVVGDRVYPEDAVGIMAETTLDSGKVAINTYMTVNPRIVNVRGMYDTSSPQDVDPAQMLSATSLLVPFATHNDSKRSNYISIQMSHALPMEHGEVMRVRTGYEKIVAHRTDENFACPAQRAGKVIDIDEKLNLIRIQYDREMPHIAGPIKLPITKNEITYRFNRTGEISVLCLEKDLLRYHLNDVVTVNEMIQLQITSTIKYGSVDKVPNLDTFSKIEQDHVKGSDKIIVLILKPVPYDPSQDIDIFQFGEKFTSVSGSHVTQNIVLNVKKGDRVKKGDIIAYNSGFFDVDEYNPSQVNWKHGVMARAALMEVDATYEDSTAISKDFSRRMSFSPAHVRVIKLTSNTVLHSYAEVGTEVQTTDFLCVIEDADIDAMTLTDDPDTVTFLQELNRKAPRAKYSGHVKDIDVLFSCPPEQMHPSVRKLVDAIVARHEQVSASAENTRKAMKYPPNVRVPAGTKYRGEEFDTNTILFLFTIAEELPHGIGDKLTINAAKSTTAVVLEKPIYTESGLEVDMITSGKSLMNRMITDTLYTGSLQRIMIQLEDNAVDMYFEEK